MAIAAVAAASRPTTTTRVEMRTLCPPFASGSRRTYGRGGESVSIRSRVPSRSRSRLDARARSALRPPSRPLRVLDPRRRVPDPGPREARRRARDAGRRAHRPRLARGCGRPLQSGTSGGREAGHRLRGLRHRRPPCATEGTGASHAPRRDERGLREPDQALLARLPRGLLLQAARRLGASPAARERADRPLRLPLWPRLQGARGEPARGCRGRARPAGADLRPRERLRRAPERAPRRAAADQPRARRSRREARHPDRRDRRRPLPPPRGRARPRGAPLHPVGRLAQEPRPLALRDGPLLLQDAGGDGRRLPRPRGRAPPHARGRPALQRRDRARPDPPAEVRHAGGTRRVRVPRRARRGGRGEALRHRHAGDPRAPPVRAEDDQGDGLLGLLPDRRRPDRLRPARRRERRPGPRLGRRSLVAYCLEITDLDPLPYNLLFERFLNPGRKSMPDIDLDFAVEGRERVINYAGEKYGRDRVAQIITFGTMAARAAVRDAGRVLDHPYGVVDRIAKMIPEGPGQTLDACLEPGGELRVAYDSDPAAKEIVDLAKPLEGLTRQDGIHAAAVVIGAEPLMNIVPLQRKGADQEVVTQFSGTVIESIGFLKIDFLGLRNLDVIDKACQLAGVDISTIPLDDRKTYEMLARGESIGVFQFEGSGMREALRLIKPTEFDDLIAIGALYRPGPMQYIPSYAARKNGREAVTYSDERLKEITSSTYGICIYQEQYMEIAKRLAGFTPAEADDLRKAIGKKIHSLMASLKTKFLEGCAASGTTPAVATQLWQDMEKSQDYSFNKSHAACYALTSYRTAWLRANHPREYMAALISSVMNTKDKVPFYVAACDELGIEVLPPDVNESQVDFAVVDGKIRFGLNAVKNVGEATCRAIVAAREEEGPFTSVGDLVARVDAQLL